MKSFINIFVAAVIISLSCCVGCSHQSAPTMLIQGKPVADWIKEVEIGGSSNNQAVQVLTDAGPPVMPQLIHFLEADKLSSVQAKAAFVISIICYRNPNAPEVVAAIPAITKAAQKSSDNDTRIYAAQSLGAIGMAASNAAPVLILLTKDKNASVRMCAVEDLGRIKIESPESIAALQVALSDSSSDVRITAKHSLDLIQSK